MFEMRSRSKKLLMVLTPMLLFGAIWGINWRRLHPPPSELDEQIRALLLSSDRIGVEVENIEPPEGGFTTFVTRLSPAETQSVVRSINLTQEQPGNWGTGYVPIVYVKFYKNGKYQGSLSSSYSVWGFNYFSSSHHKIRRGLHPTTLRRLRQLIARHPEIMRALVAAGADSQYLDPNAFAKNRP